MKAVFWNKTVLGFRPVQELALRHKDGRTGRGAEGHSHHEWCFYGFCPCLIVSLTGKTVENTHARQKKEGFLLFCARLIVSLQSEMSTETTVIEKNQIKKPL